MGKKDGGQGAQENLEVESTRSGTLEGMAVVHDS